MTNPEYNPAGPDAPKSPPVPQQFQLVAVRECPFYDCGPWADEAQRTQAVLAYWKQHVAKSAGYDSRFEFAAMLLLDDEKRLFGHVMLARGGESFVFADACHWLAAARALNASFVMEAHNHPGGNAHPSELDIWGARTLASQVKAWKLELVDSVVIGDGEVCSLAANGFLEGAESGPENEPVFCLDAREKWKLSVGLLFPDRELQSLVIDEAHKAGVSTEDWVFEHMRGLTRLHLAGLACCDARPALVSAALSGPDEKLLLSALFEEAADRGLSTWDCGYAIGVEGLRERLRARLGDKKDLNSAAVERVAAGAEQP